MDEELEILLKYLPGGEVAKTTDLEKKTFVKYIDKIIDASYGVSYAGLRYGDRQMYFNGLLLPKSLFLGVLDFEKLNEYNKIRYLGEGFFESGETDGFKEVVLGLRDYGKFLKGKLLEVYKKRNRAQL